MVREDGNSGSGDETEVMGIMRLQWRVGEMMEEVMGAVGVVERQVEHLEGAVLVVGWW